MPAVFVFLHFNSVVFFWHVPSLERAPHETLEDIKCLVLFNFLPLRIAFEMTLLTFWPSVSDLSRIAIPLKPS